MDDHRTPQHDSSDTYSNKLLTADNELLTPNRDALAGFVAIFGDQTIGADGVFAFRTFFGQTYLRDLRGSDGAYITGRSVSLSEVA